MPSKSKAQRHLMLAVEHNPEFAAKAGIPQQVGRDYAAADKARGKAALAKLPARVKPKTTMEKYR